VCILAVGHLEKFANQQKQRGGTVQCMSPEQVEADPHDLDTRSDVYALGVVLYELLCEQFPYDVRNVKLFDATRIVREQKDFSKTTCHSSMPTEAPSVGSNRLSSRVELLTSGQMTSSRLRRMPCRQRATRLKS
jgi:serine/threonine protein kinase